MIDEDFNYEQRGGKAHTTHKQYTSSKTFQLLSNTDALFTLIQVTKQALALSSHAINQTLPYEMAPLPDNPEPTYLFQFTTGQNRTFGCEKKKLHKPTLICSFGTLQVWPQKKTTHSASSGCKNFTPSRMCPKLCKSLPRVVVSSTSKMSPRQMPDDIVEY